MRKIIVIVLRLISFIAIFAGIIDMLNASQHPNSYQLWNASAVQVTQVYTEAMFMMLEAIALFLFAIAIHVVLIVEESYESKKTSHKLLSEMQTSLNKIGHIARSLYVSKK